MLLPITCLYAGILALWFLLLSVRVSFARGRDTPLGDGGDRRLLSVIRGQQNFAEYVPFILLMMALLESGGVLAPWVLHAIGVTLVVARVAHAFTMSFAHKRIMGRFVGAMLTYLLLLITGLLCLWRGLGVLLIS